MNLADKHFREIVTRILNSGHKRQDRTGVGTIGLFGMQYHFQVDTWFPLLSLRKIHTKSVIHELLWFLGAFDEKYKYFGNTNIRYLLDNNVTFWTEWPYKDYCKKREFRPELPNLTIKEFEEKIKTDDSFAKEFGDIGPGYGKQWTNWGGYTEEKIIKKGDMRKAMKLRDEDIAKKGEAGTLEDYMEKDIIQIEKHEGINQVDNVIDLLKNNPDSRRIILETWNVSEIDQILLPPCHKTLHFNTYRMDAKERYYEFTKWANENNINIEGMNLNDATNKFNFPTRKLNLLIYIRSNDIYLGWPFNIAEYSLLLKMIAQVTNMIAYELVYTGGDTHLYLNSIDAAKEVISRNSKSSPKLKLNPNIKNIYDFRYEDIEIVGYDAHPNIKVDVAV